MNSQKATYLTDSYLDYRRIAVILLTLVIMFFASGRVHEFLDGRRPGRMVDATAYLKNAKKLTFINEGQSSIALEYSQYNNDYEYLSNNSIVKPEFTKNHDGTQVTIKFPKKYHKAYEGFGARMLMHGPSVADIEIRGPVDLTYSGNGSLSVINDGSLFSLRAGGRYKHVKIKSARGALSRLDYVDIQQLDIVHKGGVVTAGEVGTLNVDFSTECESRNVLSARHTLTVESVRSGVMRYNGMEQPVRSIANDCGRMVIGA